MNSKHTTGSWHIDKVYGQFEIISAKIETDVEHLIATVCCSHVARPSGRCNLRGKDEAEANARLIATAPELLDACQAAIHYDVAIRECANDPDKMASYCTAEGDALDTLYADWIDKARAAITKTTGEKVTP